MANLTSLVHELRERITAPPSTSFNKQNDEVLESRFRAVLPNLLQTYVVPSSSSNKEREVIAILKLLAQTAKIFPGVFYHGKANAVLPVIGRILPFFAEPTFRSRHGVIFETVGSLLSLLRTGDRDVYRQFFMDIMSLNEDLLYIASICDERRLREPTRLWLKSFGKSFARIRAEPALLGDIPLCNRPTSGEGILVNLTGKEKWLPFATSAVKLLNKCLTEGTLYIEGLLDASCVLCVSKLLCYGDDDLHMACLDFARIVGVGKNGEILPTEKLIQSLAVILSKDVDTVSVFSQSDVVSNVISGVVRGSKDQKAREFPSFELLSQESLSDCQHLDCEKSLDIVGEGNANVENEEQSSPNSKSHFDDIIFTTQDIKMIEEMEHSVTKKDVVGKRAAVKSAVLRSPYTTDFGSADCKELILYPKDIRKGISAFPDECMKFPNVSEVLLFDEVYKFPGSSDNINPPFSFGDIRISSKMWFYSLLTPNKWINDDASSHINIAFYYLRKLARHSPKVRVKVTTVNSWFHVKITNLYKEYIMKCFHKYVLREEMDIREYVLGYSMCINTPWAEVDYVLFPINMDKPGHWFLLIFDIRRRALVLYNTLEQSSVVMKLKLKEVCEPYVFSLPIILSGCGFWKSRNDIDRTTSSFTKYGLDGPLELASRVDCGVFTIGFAEHFIFQKMEDMLTRFSVKAYRKKLCVNLYVHASNKEVCGYESDIEHPGRYIP
ncbi:hypothetical protein OROHE_019168 [Orobanche hederae]